MHAWRSILQSVDEDLIAYEEALVNGKLFDSKRLDFFNVDEADKIELSSINKKMILRAIVELPLPKKVVLQALPTTCNCRK